MSEKPTARHRLVDAYEDDDFGSYITTSMRDPEYAAAFRDQMARERRARMKRYRMCGCVDIIARDGAVLGGWGRVDCSHDPGGRALRVAYRRRQLARCRRSRAS